MRFFGARSVYAARTELNMALIFSDSILKLLKLIFNF
jgi:hypothetical protein